MYVCMYVPSGGMKISIKPAEPLKDTKAEALTGMHACMYMCMYVCMYVCA